MPCVLSTLKRPPEHLVRRFHTGQVGGDTIRTFLEKGYSLAICCQDCPRMIEWTPPALQKRFGDRLDLRMADLVRRLSCAGDDGCGSRFVAVFPHFYDQPWTWSPPAGGDGA